MRTQLLLVSLAAWIAVACGAPAEDTSGSSDELTQNGQTKAKFDVDRLLEDSDILGGSKITAAQVQAFLDEKGSFLATYKQDGELAAKIIVDRCREKGVNPVYMLARIQGESSLVESKTAKEANIPKATGCGCPDGKACADEFKGFANQITCAANLIRKYFTSLESTGKTVSGYAVNKQLKTLDPCTVTPKNKATVALYTYTPWVGSYGEGCGTSKWMGSSGMAHLTVKYKDAFPASATEPGPGGDDETEETPFCETAAGRKDPSCESITPTGPITDPEEVPPETDPLDPSPTCTVQTELELCDAAFSRSEVECGVISDGCGGTVNCSTVTSFGCLSGETCSANRCVSGPSPSPTPTPTTCVPKSTALLCTTAKQDGVECGRISDGCGSSVSCDGVVGLGCAENVTCSPAKRCEKKAAGPAVTPPPAETPTETRLPTETPPEKAGDVGDESGDDDEDKPKADSTKAPKAKKAESGGCSSTPTPARGGPFSALTLLVVAGLLRRRRAA